MEQSVHSPMPGADPVTPVLSPAEVKRKYFEFFDVGTHKEVLLLGDLVEQLVHWVQSKRHKVLCVARQRPCELCAKAATSDDVETLQSEFYAASFVRSWRERTFFQKVAVFSAAACETILKLADGQPLRGRRLEVTRSKQGNSARFKIGDLAGLPAGFPVAIPPAFDLVPFVVARYGGIPDPRRPMTLLESFQCERVQVGPSGRPKPLDISANSFVTMTPDEAEALLVKARQTQWSGMIDRCEAVLRAAGRPIPAAVASPGVNADGTIADSPRPKLPTVHVVGQPGEREPLDLHERIAPTLSQPLGPRHRVAGTGTTTTDDEALTERAGHVVCDEVKNSAPACLRNKKPQPPDELPATVGDVLNGHARKGGAR